MVYVLITLLCRPAQIQRNLCAAMFAASKSDRGKGSVWRSSLVQDGKWKS